MKRIITIAAFCIAASATCAQDTRFQSVWHAGTGRSLHTGLLSLEQFEDRMETFRAEGVLRLVDIETMIANGRRGYAGLWTEGSGGNALDRVTGLAALRALMRSRASDGLRLIDVEPYRENGRLRFLALFRPGTGDQRVDRPLPIAKFLERKDLFRTLGLHLHDVEALVIDGEIRFIGLYRADTPPAVFTGFRPRENLMQLRDRMVSDGWELFDIERTKNARGEDVYFALWRQGDGNSRLSRFRRAGQQFTFSLEQQAAGRQAVDFELRRFGDVDPDDPRPLPQPDPPQPVLPSNPPHVTITDDVFLRIQFTQIGDAPFSIEIPRRWLPDWLPEQNGEILLPDSFCALSIRHADSIFWQVPGDSAVNIPPFQSLETVPPSLALEGIRFSGPIGACFGTQTNWVFDAPFTNGNTPFEPLENMSLVISAVNGELGFLPSEAPHAEPFDAHELFTSDTEDELSSVLDAFEGLFDAQERIDDYCETVGMFWTAVCQTAPGSSCPPEVEILPACALP
ncbi:hypothetical protein ACXYMO_14550 [Arenibacterium sp. CAU 1754]